MSEVQLKPWSDKIDPKTIPDDVMKTERGRRNALKRTSYTGGIYWKKHNPDTSRCRCRRCMKKRESEVFTPAVLKNVVDATGKVKK